MKTVTCPSPTLLMRAGLLVFALLTAQSASAQSLFDLAVRGTSCNALSDSSLFCTYQVGKDLEFSITSVGQSDTGISFLRSNINGDYFARYGVMHGCIIVERGMTAPKRKSPEDDYAFVSPKTGQVYKSWQECQAVPK